MGERSRQDGKSLPANVDEQQVSLDSNNTAMSGVQDGTVAPTAAIPSQLNPGGITGHAQLDVGTHFGQYDIEAKLGQGGMGAVYKARHVRLDKHVAIKVLPGELTRDATLITRFDREMKAVGKLEHPNIVRAMDAGEVDGTHYLVMEYVEGIDLHNLVRTKGNRSVVEACELIRQAAQGLAHAHQHGLVHRDIKPGNLLLSKQGKVKVLDLGLARLHSETSTQDGNGESLTSAGICMGTPDFMAPEQWENTHTVDGRADLYALGCTLYFLLVGNPPYHDPNNNSAVGKMTRHVTYPIPDLKAQRPDVPDELNQLFQQLMAKKLEDRPATGTEVVQALVSIIKSLRSPQPAEATAGKTASVKPARKIDSELAMVLEKVDHESPGPQRLSRAKRTHPRSVDAGKTQSQTWKLVAAGSLALVALLGVIIVSISNRDGTRQASMIEVPDRADTNVSVPEANEQPGSRPPAGSTRSDLPGIVDVVAPGGASATDTQSTMSSRPKAEPVPINAPAEPMTAPPTGSPPSTPQISASGSPANSQPGATASPAPKQPMTVMPAAPSGPATIRVGPDEGMISLDAAFEKAQGGDTIEICTDEPIVVMKQLAWNRPGTLNVCAMEGKHPILMAGAQGNQDILNFDYSSSSAVAPETDTITLSGLTLLDLRQSPGLDAFAFVKVNRSINISEVTFLTQQSRFVGTLDRNQVNSLTLDRCDIWYPRKTTSPSINARCLQLTIRDSMITGGGGIHFGYESQVFTCERSTFLWNDSAWNVLAGASVMQMNRNLFFGLNKIGDFYPLTESQVHLAATRLKRYSGTYNAYFQCDRMVLRLTSKPEMDFAAWQQFTNNGEANPHFEVPQFARPELLELARSKIIPPQLLGLKPTSKLKRLKIGCDVTRLPELPPKLHELLPPELRWTNDKAPGK